ncbi:hypothetical protein T08_10539 [Trichinella sp. T8]|nr:hypothetical protein T08_8627 [Trichinella sp. T8]KRZ85549.1 hypothetical protein T08_10539 [Trichinella sp. T8]
MKVLPTAFKENHAITSVYLMQMVDCFGRLKEIYVSYHGCVQQKLSVQKCYVPVLYFKFVVSPKQDDITVYNNQRQGKSQ